MRIVEIIDTAIRHQSTPGEFNIDSLKSARASDNTAERGMYAHGKVNPNDPHEFHKTTYMPSDLDNDAYYQFVKVIGPYMKSNPFLPRVYVVDIVSDRTGKTVPTYNIETLQRAANFSGESLVGIGDSIFSDFNADNGFDIRNNAGHMVMWATLIKRVNSEIYLFNKTGSTSSSVINRKFTEAVSLIVSTLQSNDKFKLDLHTGNYLLRGTPGGPQLVFADPLTDNGVSIIGGPEDDSESLY